MASGGSDSGEGEGASSGDEFMEVEGAVGGLGVTGVGGASSGDEVNGGRTSATPDRKSNLVVNNDPVDDLEAYINGYSSGIPKINRLNYIADHCPPLAVEALKLAMKFLKESVNVSAFKLSHQKLQTAISNQTPPMGGAGAAPTDLPHLDQEWIDASTKIASDRFEKFTKGVNFAMTQTVTKQFHLKLGEHYLEMGDFKNALNQFFKARDILSRAHDYSVEDLMKVWMGIIRTEMWAGNWSNAFAHLAVLNPVAFQDETFMPMASPGDKKAADSNSELDPRVQTLLLCIAGLTKLGQRKYKSAANYFLQAKADHLERNEFITASNVGVYGSICVLAVFDREELQSVLSNNSFKSFLEADPEVLESLTAFYNSEYSACLQLLGGMKDKLRLDLYLGPHIDTLYSLIRQRGIAQYCAPFAKVDLNRMATEFNTTTADLENELIGVIFAGKVHGRMDSQSKVLIAGEHSERQAVFDNALKMGQDYERRTKMMMLRAAMLENNTYIHEACPDPKQKDGKGGKGKGKKKSAREMDPNENEMNEDVEELLGAGAN